MTGPTLSRIIVSFNSGELLYRAVGAVESPKVQTIVVDNHSVIPPDRDRLAGQGASLHLLDHNLGFGRACNRGADRATGQWLAFVNPDTEVSGDLLELAVKSAVANGWTFVGVPLEDANGVGELVVAPGPGPWVLFGVSMREVLGDRLVSGTRRRLWKATGSAPNPVGPLAPDRYLSGACLMVEAKAFREVGGFDERIFLYGEDAKLCRDLSLAGHRGGLADCWPGLHHRGASGGDAYYRSERALPLLAHAATLDRSPLRRAAVAASLLPGLTLAFLREAPTWWRPKAGRCLPRSVAHVEAIGRCVGRGSPR